MSAQRPARTFTIALPPGLALLNLKALAKSASTPFAGSIEEIKKDAEWLESLK